jgi:hypothetical protein
MEITNSLNANTSGSTVSVTSVTNSITGSNTGGLGGSNGANTLTLSGSNLDSSSITAVSFMDSSGVSKYQTNIGTQTSTTLTTSYQPSMKPGTYTVTVHLNTGPLSGSTATFEIKEPTNTTLSHTQGSHVGGTPVTITGKYLGNASNVLFGTVAANDFNSANNSDTSIPVTSPAKGTKNKVSVYVQFPGGAQAAVGDFVYVDIAFKATGFYPNFASAVGQTIKVIGSDLTSANVSGVEIWDISQSQKVATATNVVCAISGDSLTFEVPTGLTVDTSYSIAVVAANGAGKRFATAPGSPNFSYLATTAIPATQVVNSKLTDGKDTLTLKELLTNQTLTVLSTGDFAASGYLFLETTEGVALLSYSGADMDTTTLNQGYYTGQFTGVSLENPVPSTYAAISDFVTSEKAKVMLHHATVFQASTDFGYTFNIDQSSGETIECAAYYSSAVPEGHTPTFYMLALASGNNYKWVATQANQAVNTFSLAAGNNALKLPLLPINSANFIFTKGAYTPALTTNGAKGVPRPAPYTTSGSVNQNTYDFVEYTFDGTAGDPSVSLGTRTLPKLTIDTSQVDQLGFPIQITADSGASVSPIHLATQPPTQMTMLEMGVDDSHSRDDITSAYKSYLTSYPDYQATLMSKTGQPTEYLRITNPSDILSHASNAATSPLNWVFDQAVYDLFTSYTTSSPLKIATGNAGGLNNAVFKGVSTQHPTSSYQVLKFNSTSATAIGDLYVYMPLFSDNKNGAPNQSLYQSLAAPSWLTSGQTSGFMILANNGVFTDSGAQPGLTSDQQSILGNIENQLVAALNRGVANVALAAPYQNNTELWQDPSQQYPSGKTANAYAAFMHTHKSNSKTIFLGAAKPAQSLDYGFAYAIAYDDQGNLSTTMTVVNSLDFTTTLSSWS